MRSVNEKKFQEAITHGKKEKSEDDKTAAAGEG